MRIIDIPLFLVTDKQLSCVLSWTEKSVETGMLPTQKAFLSSGGVIIAIPTKSGHTIEIEDLFLTNNSGAAAAIQITMGSGGPLVYRLSLADKKQLSFVNGFGWAVQP